MMEISRDDMIRARAIARGDVELESVACEALVVAARDFDGRGTFSGYSGQRMSWAVANERKRLHTIRARETAFEDDNAGADLANPDLPPAVEKAINDLPAPLRDALLNGPHDKRCTPYRAALAAVRAALGVTP